MNMQTAIENIRATERVIDANPELDESFVAHASACDVARRARCASDSAALAGVEYAIEKLDEYSPDDGEEIDILRAVAMYLRERVAHAV